MLFATDAGGVGLNLQRAASACINIEQPWNPAVLEQRIGRIYRYLYVSCWGTGEFIQYDVSDPFNPKRVSSLRLGGIVSRAAHPSKPGQPLNGGPQMVEISRDSRRIYFTNSLYTPWDNQFYPDGVQGWMTKVNVRPGGGMELDKNFFLDPK